MFIQCKPNPAERNTVITINSAQAPIPEFVLQIRNTEGLILYKKRIYSKREIIRTENWPAGIYFIDVHSEYKRVIKRLIVM